MVVVKSFVVWWGVLTGRFVFFSSWYLMSLVLLLSSFLSSFLSPGYACAAPGTVCDRCDLHQKIRHNSEGMEDVCPFCLNVKVAGVTPICEEPACQDVKDLAGAIACDKKVDDYCKALQASGSNDPGCINYVSEERKWAVPRVANKCKGAVVVLAVLVSDILFPLFSQAPINSKTLN